MITFLSWLLFVGACSLSYFAEKYRKERDMLKIYNAELEGWVDEIIEALEDPNEEGGNEKIDTLVAQVTDE